MQDIDASFNLENLVCELYRRDIDVLNFSKPAQNKDICKDLFFEEEKYFLSKGQFRQQIPIKHLSHANLSEQSNRILFHERVHYWQTLSCTSLQYRLVSLLDKIAFSVEKISGRSQYICNQIDHRNFESEKLINNSFNSMNSNFDNVSNDKIIFGSHNHISDDPFTAMPYVRFPHRSGGSSTIPAYAGVLGFKETESVILVPFSGRHIVECAAYIAEHLSCGLSIPKMNPAPSKLDILYLGIWEFWSRLFKRKYKTEKDLALAFLSVVDLVLNPDLHDIDTQDEEIFNETTSIPYRFGKLVYRMQDLPILDCENQNIDNAIIQFQETLAKYSYWTSPTVTTKKMIIFLSQIIIRGLLSRSDIDMSNINMDDIKWLFTTQYSQAIQGFDRVEMILNKIYGAFSSVLNPRSHRSFPLGINTLTTMLHSLFYRMKYPSHFCAPHIYSDKLSIRYPLPVVLFQNDYYSDIHLKFEYSDEFPFRAFQMETMLDILGITALSPLAYGSSDCGFFNKKIRCWHYKNGNAIRCPQHYLDQHDYDENEYIDQVFDVFCHWSFYSLAFETVPPKYLEYYNNLKTE